jgi:hypothetical protein
VIDWTRVRLTRWGNWCKGGRRTGYPTAAAFVHANEGGRGSDTGCDMPDDIQEVEDAVRHMSHELAGVIIQVYARTGPLWLKAVKLQISKNTLKSMLRIAEDWIDKELSIK